MRFYVTAVETPRPRAIPFLEENGVSEGVVLSWWPQRRSIMVIYTQPSEINSPSKISSPPATGNTPPESAKSYRGCPAVRTTDTWTSAGDGPRRRLQGNAREACASVGYGEGVLPHDRGLPAVFGDGTASGRRCLALQAALLHVNDFRMV